jgi:aminopeptidase N
MEYPTLFTSGSRLHSPLATLEPEGLILHELAHQYFHGLVASDEAEEPYLDEGLVTYATARALSAAYPPPAWSYELWGWLRVWPAVTWTPLVDEATAFLRRPQVDPVTRTSWGFLDSRAYGMLSYYKMALLLAQIERTVGADAMERAMRAYATRFRFGHPRTADLERVLSEQTGRDLDPCSRSCCTAPAGWTTPSPLSRAGAVAAPSASLARATSAGR